jgi:hypothetical protein
MVIRPRRRALNVAKALRDIGEVPPGVDDAMVCRARSRGVIVPRTGQLARRDEEVAPGVARDDDGRWRVTRRRTSAWRGKDEHG